MPAFNSGQTQFNYAIPTVIALPVFIFNSGQNPYTYGPVPVLNGTYILNDDNTVTLNINNSVQDNGDGTYTVFYNHISDNGDGTVTFS